MRQHVKVRPHHQLSPRLTLTRPQADDPQPTTPCLIELQLLLLGAGASGKSTVLKQMRLIHDVSFTPAELECESWFIFCLGFSICLLASLL
jgi:hypothetical protein